MDFNDVQHGEEMEMSPASSPPPPQQQPGFVDAAASSRAKMGPTGGGEGSSGARKRGSSTSIRYRECLKNHAVTIGGHALDGCGGFLAAGEEGTIDSLKCAACGCHRNFHRKEPAADSVAHKNHVNQHPAVSAFYRHPAAYSPPPPSGYLHLTHPGQQRPLALTSASAAAGSGGSHSREEGGGEDYVSNPRSSGGGSGSGMLSKRRFRTKFTTEQKEKMMEFAEKVGWRIQKHDEAAVEEFCAQTGLKRQVLKVWMHNNKHTIGRKP